MKIFICYVVGRGDTVRVNKLTLALRNLFNPSIRSALGHILRNHAAKVDIPKQGNCACEKNPKLVWNQTKINHVGNRKYSVLCQYDSP